MSIHSLAGLLEDQGDLVGARLLYERALAIFEKALGSNHPYTATARKSLQILLGATLPKSSPP
jgi:hypothetical protein